MISVIQFKIQRQLAHLKALHTIAFHFPPLQIQHRMEKEVEETQKVLPKVEMTKGTEIQILSQNAHYPEVDIDPSSTAWAKVSFQS